MMTARATLQGPVSKNDTPKANPAESHSQYPAVDFMHPMPESADPKIRAERSAKSRRYDKKGVVSSAAVKGEALFGDDWDVGLTGIPVRRSDAVVVGEVLGAQAHLSRDKGAVYSEFTVRVDEVLRNDGGALLAAGQSITAERFGGVVKYGPGFSRLYRMVGQDLPRVGRRYVLFLKSVGEGQDYSIVLGYELRSEKIFLLDELPVTAPYEGADAASFLKTVRETTGQ